MQLILASSSKPRAELLQRLQVPFEIAIPDVDETILPEENPIELVKRLAKLKSHAVADKYKNALIIGADIVGVLDGKIINKPSSLEEAADQLLQMSGCEVKFLVGVSLLNSATKECQIEVEEYNVYFKKLHKEIIHQYLNKENVLQCAGSLKAEGLGITLIERFSGNDYTALIGLPLICLTNMLQKAGLNPLR